MTEPSETRYQVVQQQAGDYTLALNDDGSFIQFTSAEASTLTIPAAADEPFETGAELKIEQAGAGAVTIEGAEGVTVNGLAGLVSAGQYAVIELTLVGPDTWVAHGNLTT